MAAPLKALCVVPFGMEEGTSGSARPGSSGWRSASRGVPLPQFHDSKEDRVGDLLENWGDELEELSPLEVTLTLEGQQGTVLPVRLESRVTEIGTLELWCVSRDSTDRWKLELNIREKSDQ